ncbi:MAG: O-antigen ligase family protein [Anaerolineae bacterium]|nr:O-antigen ligase family protein [Anaerolineae bacterium]
MRRLGRIGFILLAIYLVFIGGSAYYTLIFPVRVLHHVLITLLLTLWLVGQMRRGRGLPHTPLNWPLLAAVIVWLVTALASADPRMALENLWFQVIHVLFFFVLVDMIQRGRQRLVMETQFMLGAAVVFLSGLELASWYFGLGIIPGTQIGWIDVIGAGVRLPLVLPRLSLAFNLSTLVAGYVVPLILLVVGWALTARRRDYRIVLWILAVLLALILVLTFSRGGLLGILAGVGTLATLRLSQNRAIGQRIPGRLVIAGAVLTGAVLTAGFIIWSVSESGTRDFGDAGRLDMWRGAVSMLRDHPLTGVGYSQFGRAFRSYRDPALVQDKLVSAHNVYLNTAAETGLPGILVSLWLGVTIFTAWRRNWQTAGNGRKIRLEAVMAGMIGMGIHSLVDVFTITPIVTILLLMVAYSITQPGSRLDNPPQTPRWTAIIVLFAIFGYGVWFIQLDRTQSIYQRSFNPSATAIDDAQEAATIDPALNLYALQVAYLQGQDILTNPNADIAAYQAALEREPSWDVGWINLAALILRQGDQAQALAYLDAARQINAYNTAGLYWAQLAEATHAAPDSDIIQAYVGAMSRRAALFLPLSDYWTATELRRVALDEFLADLPLDLQYRILVVHAPEQAYALVPATPQTPEEWWVAGEYALTFKHDAEAAVSAFTRAITSRPTYGDYYAARARAEIISNPQAAQYDLDIAALLTTIDEYPNAIRAELADTPEAVFNYRATALPPRQVRQEFATALYGRPAQFDLFPEMRPIGPGRAAMQPWYAVAEERLTNNDREGAANAYRAILEYAPDEQEARDKLAEMEGGGT